MKADSFTKASKVVEYRTSLRTSAVLGELLYKQNYWIKEGGIEKHVFKKICVDGKRTNKSIKSDSFYWTFSDIREEKPSLNLKAISKAVIELEELGLIYYQKGYLGKGSRFWVLTGALNEFLDTYAPLLEKSKKYFSSLDRHDGTITYDISESKGCFTDICACNTQTYVSTTKNLTNNSIIDSVTHTYVRVAESTIDKGIEDIEERNTALPTDQTLEANGLKEDEVSKEKPFPPSPATKKEETSENKAEDIFKKCIEGYDFTNEGWDKLYDNLKETKYVSDAEPKDRGYMKKVMDKLHKDGKLIERLTGNSNGSKQPLMNIMMDMSTTPW